MEAANANAGAGFDVYGQNNAKLGWMDNQGVVWCNEVVIFRVIHGAIYSMHGAYLGRLTEGVGKTARGQLIFSIYQP